MRRIALLFVVVFVAASAVSGSGYAEDNPPLTYPGVGEELGGEGAVGGDSPTEPPDEVSPEEEEEVNGGSPAPESTPAAQPVNPDPPPKGPEPAPQPAPAPAPEQPPAAQPTVAVPTTVIAAVLAQPQAPPDICVNYPGMKTVPDEWTRSNNGVCSPPPPRGGYCDPKTGKFYDLARGQDKTEPYASMNLVDAYADPVSGSISCDFPKSQEEATPITTQSMKTASTQPVSSPPKVITPAETKPIPPPPRASPGPVASPSPAQPAQKSRSIAPPPSAPPAP